MYVYAYTYIHILFIDTIFVSYKNSHVEILTHNAVVTVDRVFWRQSGLVEVRRVGPS